MRLRFASPMPLVCIRSAVLASLFTCLLFGQGAAELGGTVTDIVQKAAVSDVAVTVTRTGTGAEKKTVTDDQGMYVVSGLQPGTYDIQLRKDGFQTVVKNNVKLQAGDKMQLDFEMSLGASAQSVTVTTAEKKEERVKDVPESVTVLDPGALAERGETRLVDYFASVPGLSIGTAGAAANSGGMTYVTIRGLSTSNNSNPTTATVIDDVPVGSSNVLAFGNETAPDLDPSDLAQIEVLKGPQGTLYGADSLGGLIKYVTADPSFSSFTGRVEVDGTDVSNGGAGYGVRGAANLPVSDVLALRVSAFDREDPGFINNPVTGQTHFNTVNVYGSHVALLYKPSSSFYVKLSALFQNADGNGADFVNANFSGKPVGGSLEFTSPPGSTQYHTRWQLYTATLGRRVAGVNIESITGYNNNFLHNFYNLASLGAVATGVYSNTNLWVGANHYQTAKWTQELHASSKIGDRIEWFLGGFYTKEDSPNGWQDGWATSVANPTYLHLVRFEDPFRFQEYAIFGLLTAHLTSRLDVEVGGRQSWNDMHYQSITIGPAFTGTTTPLPGPKESASGRAFTYSIATKYRVTDGLQTYARIATGYRIGGPNAPIQANFGTYVPIPPSFRPDETTNYELGVKGEFFEKKLSIDASLYYIDWKDIQINVLSVGNTGQYIINGARAKSEGIEASLEARPWQGFNLTVQGSYDNAALTQNLPGNVAGFFGLAGTRLPYSIPYSGGITGRQEFRVTDRWRGFVGGSVTYVAKRNGEFAAAAGNPRLAMPAYGKVNLIAGVQHSVTTIQVYVENLGDVRGVAGINTASNIQNAGGYVEGIVRPRTIGISVSRSF